MMLAGTVGEEAVPEHTFLPGQLLLQNNPWCLHGILPFLLFVISKYVHSGLFQVRQVPGCDGSHPLMGLDDALCAESERANGLTIEQRAEKCSRPSGHDALFGGERRALSEPRVFSNDPFTPQGTHRFSDGLTRSSDRGHNEH
jgi:hypothetical protein